MYSKQFMILHGKKKMSFEKENDFLNSLVQSNRFLSKETFELSIEKSKHLHDDSYIDTILAFAEDNQIEEEEMKEYISTSLLLKLTSEANKKRLLKERINQTDFNLLFEEDVTSKSL